MFINDLLIESGLPVYYLGTMIYPEEYSIEDYCLYEHCKDTAPYNCIGYLKIILENPKKVDTIDIAGMGCDFFYFNNCDVYLNDIKVENDKDNWIYTKPFYPFIFKYRLIDKNKPLIVHCFTICRDTNFSDKLESNTIYDEMYQCYEKGIYKGRKKIKPDLCYKLDKTNNFVIYDAFIKNDDE